MKNKTLIIVIDKYEDSIGFVIADGDYHKFDGLYLWAVQYEEIEKEANDLLYGENGISENISKDTSVVLNKEYNHVAVITIA